MTARRRAWRRVPLPPPEHAGQGGNGGAPPLALVAECEAQRNEKLRFRITTPEGETLIFVQLPDDFEQRNRRMQLVSSYMFVHMAQSFVMASELAEPDASCAVAVTRQGGEAGLQTITCSPLAFSETIWLG